MIGRRLNGPNRVTQPHQTVRRSQSIDQPTRRLAVAMMAAGLTEWAVGAGPETRRPAGKTLTIAQIVDISALQTDVSRDFLVGSRAAWQDIQARGGIQGYRVQHQAIEVDGSLPSIRQAIRLAAQRTDCVALVGSCADACAAQVASELKEADTGLAHVAPWLLGRDVSPDQQTFPIFADRSAQMAHALKSLASMGVQELGIVFSAQPGSAQVLRDLETLGKALQLRMMPYQLTEDAQVLGKQMSATSPALLLFLGGTPELARFTSGLEAQNRQRYVIALADVNIQTLAQLNPQRSTPLIVTQSVPLLNTHSPLLRQYRDALGRYFDEPPSPHSLAGFISARFAQEVIQSADLSAGRAGVLAAFQRRAPMELGGFRVSYGGRSLLHPFVTQSLLTPDGRLVG